MKVINIILITLAIVVPLAAIYPIIGTFKHPKEIPGAIGIGLIVLAILTLAVFQKISLHIRGWGLLLVGYLACILDFTRTSLPGDAPYFLIVLPIVALILINLRAAIVMMTLAIITYFFLEF